MTWHSLESKLSSLYRNYAIIVARYPLPFLLLPFLLTTLLSLGIFRLNVVRGVDYLFATRDAPYKHEIQVLMEHWSKSDDHFYPGKDLVHSRGAFVLPVCKDGGSILRPKHAIQFIRLMKILTEEITFAHNDTIISYQEVCIRYRGSCFLSSHATFISKIFAYGDHNHFNVTYPYFRSAQLGEELYLGDSLGGVTVDRSNRIISARAWIISFLLKMDESAIELSRKWELALTNVIDNKRLDKEIDLLQLNYFHSQTFDNEMLESGKRVLPKFVATFFILVVFSIIGTCTCVRLKGGFPVVDWVLSKPILALAGLTSAILGIISAMGTLVMFGMEYADMVNVMPFLAVSIGIDDMFVMLACWRASDTGASVENRLSEAMSHAAVSITITSLTDSLSFAIGALAPMPAVTIFCSYASMAVVFTFLYTMTFFLAVMVYQARLEQKSRHSVFGTKTYNPENVAVGSDYESLLILKDARPWYKKFFEDKYAPFICQNWVRFIAMIMLIAYLSGGILGVSRLQIGFELKNVLLDDSPAMSFFEYREKYFGVDGARMDIIVSRPPDLGIIDEREKFIEVLSKFENTKFSEGRQYTQFWLFAYQRHLEGLGFRLPDERKSFYQHLTSFLLTNDFYAYDIIWNGTKIMTFRVSVGMTNIMKNDEKIEAAMTMRQIASSYPQYNMTVFTIMWPLADQFMLIIPQILFSVSVALVCMIIISLLLIPHPLCSLAIAGTIISIDIGVVGYMTWWNVNVDCVSMITIAMSVGFSVDFAAHITYGYIAADSKSNKLTPEQRVAASLGALGWPLLQGALSTLFGVMILGTVNTYIVQTCFKTIVLVILFGTFHALLFLPVILSLAHLFGLKIRDLFIEKFSSNVYPVTK